MPVIGWQQNNNQGNKMSTESIQLQLKEEQKLSLQAGEFIHTIANDLCDGKIKIEGVDRHRAEMIMELSEALRRSNPLDLDAPTLLSEGIHISKHPRSAWVALAGWILGGNKKIPNDIERL